MKNLLFVNNGSGLHSGSSGGSIRLIELIRYLKKKNFNITLVTTIGSKKLFTQHNLKVKTFILNSSFFFKKERNITHRFLSNLISLLTFFFKYKKINKNYNIVYSASDYLFDVIPCIYFKLLNKKIIFFSIIHHQIKKPFLREGNILINILSFIGQKISFFLIKIYADKIFVYETKEGKQISKKFKNKIKFIKNGINTDACNLNFPKKKKFDICFVGGLRESKGIFEFIEICNVVKLNNPNLRVIVIGAGTINMENKIRQLCLKSNFVFVNGLNNFKLLQKINESKILLSTSKEEGWGIVVLEAMASYTIVIGAYLPAYQLFNKNCFFFNNQKKIIRKIDMVLKNYKKFKKILNNNKKFSNEYLWDKVLKIDYNNFISHSEQSKFENHLA